MPKTPAMPKPDRQTSGKIKQVLLWSVVVAVAMTAAGSALSHPWSVLPAALGAIATLVAFVSMSVGVWKARYRKLWQWVEESYGSAGWLRFNQNLAALTLILMGFLVASFALTFNLLHAFNVK